MENVNCQWCRNHEKAIIKTFSRPEHGAKLLVVHYCLATSEPHDVIDPCIKRDCDNFLVIE